jgi:two-component system, OmpR family, KDP operon response regulator KdpE
MTVPEPSPATTAPRVLVVDDEPQLLRGLKIVLHAAGYIVESARTASDALELVAERPPDVLVLDGALPDGEGVEVCREVRRFSDVPILIMSSAGARREKVRALHAGADDYLRKPFTRNDLLGRLGAVLPRSLDSGGTSRLEMGELVIDLARRRVTRVGAVLLLAPTEFELVRVLAERRGRTVTDRELLRAAWGHESGQETRRLRMSVARLRAMLERNPSRPEYLISEPGIGYRLSGPSEAPR